MYNSGLYIIMIDRFDECSVGLTLCKCPEPASNTGPRFVTSVVRAFFVNLLSGGKETNQSYLFSEAYINAFLIHVEYFMFHNC